MKINMVSFFVGFFWLINFDFMIFRIVIEIGCYVSCIVWNVDLEEYLFFFNMI